MKKLSFLLFAILIYNLIFNICNCYAQWQWLYPYPQGHKLNSVTFINPSTGISVGETGTLLKSTNGGINWTYKNLGFNESYICCYMLNVTTGFIGGYYGKIYKTTNSGENWSSTTLPLNVNINNIFFLNQNTGYLAGNSDRLFKTTDCGINWSFSTLPCLYSSSCIIFFNNNTGIVAGSGSVFNMLRTSNGGLNWDTLELENDYPNKIYSMHFYDTLHGFAGGSNSILRRTSDGGITWTSNSVPAFCSNVRSIKFLNSNTGFYIADNDTLSFIYKTSNNGINWVNSFIDSSSILYSLAFAGNNVVCVGKNGRTIYSTNLGANWNSNSRNIVGDVYPVKFQDEYNIIAMNYGFKYNSLNMFRSSNGGLNWINYARNENITGIYNTYFYDLNTGYAVGTTPYQYGKILKTTNAGVNWIEKATIFNTILAGIHFINLNTGLACGMLGNIVRTSNGGENWTVVHSGGPHWHSEVRFLDENIAFSENTNGDVYKSTDGGINWFITANIGTSINSIRFLNQLTGYIGAPGGVFKTTDGGYNWTHILGGITCPSLEFYNSNTGFVSGYNGKIYRTTDGGVNWINECYVTNSITVGEFYFITSEIAFAIGSSMILKTINGGLINGIVYNNTLIPKAFCLSQNYPNPFNPTTKIKFDIPATDSPLGRGAGGMTVLKVYNILGKEIETLVNEKLNPGTYEITFNASSYPSGVYFYRLITDSFTDTKKMILLK